jgi:DNA invertase Pin-like site-specific DNA recombinase
MSNASKVAFYLRSATGNSADLQKQQKTLENSLQRFGFLKSDVSIYKDQQQSGIKYGPDLLRLQNDIINGKINFVFVSRMNRISRSSNGLSNFFKLITNYQLRFVSVHENVDSIFWNISEAKNESL